MKHTLIVLIVVMMTATTAQADPFAKPKSRKAQHHLKAGNKLVEVQNYALAIKAYKDGYLVEGAVVFLYNLALAHRKKGDLGAALDYYRNFLNRASDARPEVVKAVRKIMDEMQAELKIRKEAAANPKPAATTKPPPKRVNWTAGVHIPPPWYSDKIGWVVSGAGAIATGLGLVLLANSSSLRSDADRELDSMRRDDLRAQADTRGTLGTISSVVGVVTLGVGVLKLIVHSKQKPQPDSPSVSVAIGLNSIRLDGRF